MRRKFPEFYAHPLMQRFSRIAFEQFIGQKPPSLNRFFLLPFTLIDNSIIYTAILCEEFIDTNRDRYLFVSNFCLKPNRQQYQYYRQRGGFFSIAWENSTDDETLLFQFSRRR